MANGSSGRTFVALLLLISGCPFAGSTAMAITPGTPGPGDIHFTINAGQNVKGILPWIYGTNGTTLNSSLTGDRLGGNRWTAYNWETNASNAGADYYFENDNYLSSSNTPGA